MSPELEPLYRELNPQRVIETSLLLQKRISERFPGSGLSRVAQELVEVAQAADQVSLWLSRPIWWVRVSVAAAVLVLLLLLPAALSLVDLSLKGVGIFETAQGVEATVNNLVFLAVAVYFLFGLEARLNAP